MQIGELARKADVAVDTVRYYERRGLIAPPNRRPSGYRDYGTADVERLRFIRRGKALGFTLDEVGELLRLAAADDADRGPVKVLARRRLDEVEAQIRALQEVRATLARLVDACSGHGPVAGCPIVERVLGDDAGGCR